MMRSIESCSSSNDTVSVCAFMSAETDSTLSIFSTAARAVLDVPPQTTPGVSSTYVTDSANAPVDIPETPTSAITTSANLLIVGSPRTSVTNGSGILAVQRGSRFGLGLRPEIDAAASASRTASPNRIHRRNP